MKKKIIAIVLSATLVLSCGGMAFAGESYNTESMVSVSNTTAEATLVSTDQTFTDGTISGDLYIKQGVTLITEGTVTVNGNVYVYGTLNNMGTLTVSDSLYCLHYGNMLSAGNYDYGYFYNSGSTSITNLIVKADYLSDEIPEGNELTADKECQNTVVSISSDMIYVGETVSIEVSGAEGVLSYSSSNSDVALVDESGIVTGIAPGTATITITAAETDNYEAATETVEITVEEDTSSEDGSEDTGSADTEDGDGTSSTDTLLVRRGNKFYVNYTLKGGNADMSFTYGRDTDEVLIGDWNGDGIDTICVRRGNRFYFSNTLGGQADFYIDFGRTTDEVVAGDWDGDGCDTLCVRRGNHYYINNMLESGNAAIDFTFGREDDEVLSGDWDGDGYDTLCIRRGTHYYINNTLEGGNAAIDFTFGRTGDSVLSGDWDGDGYDTLCIRRGIHYYINNTLEGGNAAIDFTFGREGDEVYAGTWQ